MNQFVVNLPFFASQHSSNYIIFQIHRVSKISIAYERRVNQVRDQILRIMNDDKSVVLGMIDQQYNKIERIKAYQKQIERQNQKQKTQMVKNLIKKSAQKHQ